MRWITNALNVFKIGFESVKSYSNQLIGVAKKYVIPQTNTSIPFEQGYAKSSDIYSIVRKIASNAKTVPWVLKKKTGDKIEIVTEGELFNLIHKPNAQQTRQEYTEQGLIQYLIGGNVFFYTPEVIGMAPDETYLLHPQLTTIKTKLDGRFVVPVVYEYRIGGKEFNSAPDKITHLKYCNPTEFGITSLRGLSPLVAGALSMIGVNNNQTAQASILENQSTAGILSNEGEYFLQAEEAEEQQKLLDEKLGNAESFGHIVQSRAKINYVKLGLDPSQLKIIESKILMLRDLCNIWDVNSILFGDASGSTFNNVIEAKKSLWTGPIKAALESFIASYHVEIVAKFNKWEFPTGKSKYFIDLDFSGIAELQKDQKEEAAKDKIVIEGIKVVMGMAISSMAKRSLLIEQYGLTEAQANELTTPEGKKNKTLEVLTSLSPLLANKLIEKLTDEEIRALLK